MASDRPQGPAGGGRGLQAALGRPPLRGSFSALGFGGRFSGPRGPGSSSLSGQHRLLCAPPAPGRTPLQAGKGFGGRSHPAGRVGLRGAGPTSLPSGVCGALQAGWGGPRISGVPEPWGTGALALRWRCRVTPPPPRGWGAAGALPPVGCWKEPSPHAARGSSHTLFRASASGPSGAAFYRAQCRNPDQLGGRALSPAPPFPSVGTRPSPGRPACRGVGAGL